ncbi:hypothetical protein HG530_008768 [Fusarium avenaceum]|nr:hypothetical protein HG530_008768 [Fusarium avenaceum]
MLFSREAINPRTAGLVPSLEELMPDLSHVVKAGNNGHINRCECSLETIADENGLVNGSSHWRYSILSRWNADLGNKNSFFHFDSSCLFISGKFREISLHEKKL